MLCVESEVGARRAIIIHTMDDDQQLPTYTSQHRLVFVANTSSLSVDSVTAEMTPVDGGSGGAGVRSGSAWLWAPHVAIGALLLVLMAASFVRFHCKYGHKYRTGSQSFSSTLRLAPKNAWTIDKKSSATALPPRPRSGHGLTRTRRDRYLALRDDISYLLSGLETGLDVRQSGRPPTGGPVTG